MNWWKCLSLAVLISLLAGAPAWSQDRADELRVGVVALGTEAFDPAMSGTGNRPFLTPMFDTLVGSAPDGKLSKSRGIARDWKVTHSASFSRYELTLRKGVKFHNGDALTSEDIKYSLGRMMSPDAVVTYKQLLIGAIGEIQTPDPSTVVIITKKPYGFLLYDLSNVKGLEGFVTPKGYVEQVGLQTYNQKPVGTGPYRFVEHVPGNRIVYEAFPDYWGEKPRFRWLTFLMVPEETTRLAALRKRDLDIVAVSRERVKELSGFKIVTKPGDALTWNGFVSTFAPGSLFTDIRLRKALNLAINREEIRDFIFSGQATLSGGVAYGSLAVGYKPLPPYPYDPEQARKLLHEVYPNGVEIGLYKYSRSDVPEMGQMIEAVAGYWEAIGVKTKIVPSDFGTMRQRWGKHTINNYLVPFRIGNTPFQQGILQAMYSSSGRLDTLYPAPEALDKLVEEMVSAVDLEDFGEKQYKVAKYIHDNYLAMPLMEVGTIYAANPKKISHWEPELNAQEMDWQGIR